MGSGGVRAGEKGGGEGMSGEWERAGEEKGGEGRGEDRRAEGGGVLRVFRRYTLRFAAPRGGSSTRRGILRFYLHVLRDSFPSRVSEYGTGRYVSFLTSLRSSRLCSAFPKAKTCGMCALREGPATINLFLGLM